MKKFLALFIIIASLLTLASCGEEDYPPVASTDKEAATVMTVSYEGKKYEVKYELYRALFLNMRESVDGGDKSVWSGENKDEYISRIDALIKERASEIFAVFHIADKIGIDVYSKNYDDRVKEYIRVGVEGGVFGNTEITGFDGDYEKYLAYLSSINLNYSVQDLLIRYSMATEDVYKYYAGSMDSEEFLENAGLGKLEYTKDDVKAFYESDECVRILRAFLPEKYFSETRANEIRQTLAEKAKLGEDAVAVYIIQNTTTGATDIKNGDIVAKHSLDREFYAELIDTAFSTEMHCVSDVINIVTGSENGYLILYRAEKNSLHFEECYDDVAAVYVQNEIGKIIDTAAVSMLDAITSTTALEGIDRSEISMP